MPAVAHLAPSQNPFTKRLRWLMAYGPRGPMQQIDLVRKAEQLALGGLTRAEVNRLLQGKTIDPKLSTLEKLRQVLGVSLSELMPVEEGRVTREPSGLRVPKVVWSEQAVMQETGAYVFVPRELLTLMGRYVALASGSALSVIDVAQAAPAEGALMALRDPESGRLLYMRSYLEGEGRGWRFADENGSYILGDAGLCAGEVVAVLSRVARVPVSVQVQVREAVMTTP